ncbi:MAG: hypothetical protein HRT93_05930 [Piscirickettsiaceae bacterium]|nr:hypothetical protein [Piscirickettsiaceae bacterium]
MEEQRISTNVTEIENSIAISQGRKPIKQAQPTEHDIRMLKVASAVQGKLNFPWQDLLSSLEVVKKSAPKIKLMTIQPNPTKGDVLIGAEAVDLPTMLNFIDLLKEQPVFQDVLLVNQRHLGLNNKKRLSFTLKMRWKI